MGLTFSEQVAAVLLGLVPGDELPKIATSALVEGFDSPSLAALAGQSTTAYDPLENRRLWHKAMDELGMAAPDVLDAATTVVHACARMVIAGELEPREGAAKVIHVVDGVCQAGPHPIRWKYVKDALGVQMLIYYYYERDKCEFLDTTRGEIDDLILNEFRNIARKQSGP